MVITLHSYEILNFKTLLKRCKHRENIVKCHENIEKTIINNKKRKKHFEDVSKYLKISIKNCKIIKYVLRHKNVL